MESFKIEDLKENEEILDPTVMYFDFLYERGEDRSHWDYKATLGIAPDSVMAKFLQKYLKANNYRHADIYKWCQTHQNFLSSTLISYYRDLLEGREMPDDLKEAFSILPEDIGTILNDINKQENTSEVKHNQERGNFVINGLEVIPREKLVKFPEHLIEETGGVEGYLRREMSWKDIESLYSEIMSMTDLRQYLELAIKALPSEDSWHHYLKERGYFSSFSGIDSLDSFKVFFEIIQFLGRQLRGNKKISEMNRLFRDLLFSLSDNGFKYEGMHIMGLYHPVSPEQENEFTKKVLLHKVYSPDDDSSIIQSGTKEFGFNVFSVKDGEVVFNNNFLQSKDESIEEYKKRLNEALKNDGTFLMHNFGLNISCRGIWDLNNNAFHPNLYMNNALSPSFGFCNENEAYRNYILSVKKLFDENPTVKSHFTADSSPFYFNTRPAHPLIPVIINHPDIPDLRWCHASHAYIPTKNGISVIKMISSKEEMVQEENRLNHKLEVKNEE